MSNRTERAAEADSVLESFYESGVSRTSASGRRAKRAVEPEQHQALLVIKAKAPGSRATVGFLADRLQVQHHGAVELSDRLEKRGLIRRSRDGVDRRQVFLTLTLRGEKLLQRLSESHRVESWTAGPRLLKALQAVIRRAEAATVAEGS